MDVARFLPILLVVAGVVLLSGSVIVVSRTRGEWVNIVPEPKVWADDVFTLDANGIRPFDIDVGGPNGTMINIHVEISGNLTFKIFDGSFIPPIGPPYEGRQPRSEWEIANSSVAGSRDLFWVWTRPFPETFIFENHNPFQVEALLVIKSYFLISRHYEEVTYQGHLLDPLFAYPGVVAVLVGLGLNYAFFVAKGEQSAARAKLRASILLGLAGVVLILGSVFAVPYTELRRVETEHTKVWFDGSFTLAPNETRRFTIDNVRVNSSMINLHTNWATGNVYFDVSEGKEVLHTVLKLGVTNTSLLSPAYEYFWTYAYQSDM